MIIGPTVCIVIGCKGKECKMDDNFRGKRAKFGVYDDWMMSDDSVEFIVPSPKILHDKVTSERHKKLLNEIEKIIEQIPIDEIIEKYGDLIG